MNLIDMRTVFFITFSVTLLCTVFSTFLWKQNRSRYKGINYWAGDFFFQMIGEVLVSFRGFIPDLFSILISNIFITFASILGYKGFEHYLDKKTGNQFNILMMVGFTSIFSYFTFIKPDLAFRSFLIGLFWMINAIRSLHLMLFRAEKSTLSFTKPLIYAYGLFLGLSSAKVINFFVSRNTSTEYFQSGIFERVILFCILITVITITYSILLSINKRLLMDVKMQEKKYSKIFNSSSSITMLTSLKEGKILEVNDGFRETFGYQDEDIIGKPIEKLNICFEEDACNKLINDINDLAKVKLLEMNFQKKSGEIVTGLISSEIININGENMILSIINDITENKKMENSLRKSEERYKLLFENGSESIVIIQNSKVVLSNEMATVLTGYSQAELSASPFVKFIYPEDAELVLSNHMKRLKGESVDRIYTYRILKKGGHVRWVEMNSLKIDWEGMPATFNLVSDITERKLAVDALRVSEEKYRLLFENAVEAILVIQNTQIKICNPKTSTLTGYSQEELNKMRFLDFVHNEDKDRTLDFHNKRLAGTSDGTKQEFRIVRKNGEIRWIESDGIKIDWNGEKATLQFAVDITERKATEEKILYLSYFDQLTGLYNRRFYEEELKRLDTKRNLPLTLVMADVNGLKLTNDAFGHTAGDMLLQAVASIMKKELRADDILARIGGDEFVLLLPKTNRAEAQLIIKRIKDKISQTVINKMTASVSFGYETKKEENEDMEKIFAQAEDHMYRKKLLESSSMKSEMITLITRSLYERDKNEQLHSERVAELCRKTAEAMNFEAYQIGEMALLGMFHDIGKIGLDQNILNGNEISEMQRKEIKKHPETGYHILKSVSEFSHIAEYVLCHHERPDGTGYPRGLKGDEIPVESRILSIAEAYDSMTNNHYKEPIPVPDAVNELKLNMGTQFDEEIVKIFIGKVVSQ